MAWEVSITPAKTVEAALDRVYGRHQIAHITSGGEQVVHAECTTGQDRASVDAQAHCNRVDDDEGDQGAEHGPGEADGMEWRDGVDKIHELGVAQGGDECHIWGRGSGDFGASAAFGDFGDSTLLPTMRKHRKRCGVLRSSEPCLRRLHAKSKEKQSRLYKFSHLLKRFLLRFPMFSYLVTIRQQHFYQQSLLIQTAFAVGCCFRTTKSLRDDSTDKVALVGNGYDRRGPHTISNYRVSDPTHFLENITNIVKKPQFHLIFTKRIKKR